MSIPFTTEQEAAVTVLFSSLMQEAGQMTDQQIDHLSRSLVLSSRFAGSNLNELSKKAFNWSAEYTLKDIIEAAAPLIEEPFRETLFAMVSEIVLLDGQITEARTRSLAMLALYLEMSTERMKMILATYLIRNKWNVQVIPSDQA